MVLNFFQRDWTCKFCWLKLTFVNPLNRNDLSYIQAFFVPSIYMNADTIGVIDPDYGMSITTVMTKPKSRGYVKLKSSNYEDPPEISLNLLKHEDDLKMMVAGQKFFMESLNKDLYLIR